MSDCHYCSGSGWRYSGPLGTPNCIKCWNSLQNEAPADKPDHLRCATCKTVWKPEVCPYCTKRDKSEYVEGWGNGRIGHVNIDTTSVWILESTAPVKIRNVTIYCHKHHAYESFYSDSSGKRELFRYQDSFLTFEDAKRACIIKNGETIKYINAYVSMLLNGEQSNAPKQEVY